MQFSPIADEEGNDRLVVQQEISLEALKNSTIQLLLRVDTNFAETMTEKVMNKIRKNRNFTFVEVSNEENSKSNKQGEEGQQRFLEVPSNGQDEKRKSGGDIPSDKSNTTLDNKSNAPSQNMESSLSKKTAQSHDIAKSV